MPRSMQTQVGRPRSSAADEAILAAALALLREDGYARMSIESVARRADVSRPTIYRRYRDKADLAAAALAAVGDVTRPIDTGSTRTDLIELVDRFLAAVAEIGIPTVATLLVERQRHPELIESFRARVVRPRRKLMREILELGIERGEVRREVDPELVVDSLVGALFSREIAGLRRPGDWAEQLVALLWTGIATSDERASPPRRRAR